MEGLHKELVICDRMRQDITISPISQRRELSLGQGKELAGADKVNKRQSWSYWLLSQPLAQVNSEACVGGSQQGRHSTEQVPTHRDTRHL